MMEDKSVYSTSRLELCSYRCLQKLAKSLKLPSNVKKVYLVEMINAKKCSPESEVQRIIRRVKQERKNLTQVKKRSRQTVITIDSSSSESLSPAISETPKRPPCMLRCSELRHQMMRSQNSVVSTSHPGSDRVLRSCNVKLKPFMNKFVEVNQRHVDMVEQAKPMNVRVIKKCKPNILSNKERQIAPITQLGISGVKSTNDIDVVDQATQMNLRVIKKYKPNVLSNKERQIVPVTPIGSRQILVKRQRLLSGIYPIAKELVPVGGVGVRNSEGKMSALAAFIHKPQDDSYTSTRSNNSLKRNIELTLQDIINGNVEQATSLNYPNNNLARNIELTLQDVINGNIEQATSLNYPNTSGNLSCLKRCNNSLKRNIELTLQDVINGNIEQATSLNYSNTSGNLSCLKCCNNSLKRNIELTLQDVINGNIEQATSLNYPNTSGNLSCLKRCNNSLKRNIELTLQDVINGNIEQATSLNYPNTSGNLSCLKCCNNSLKRNIELTLQDVINGNIEQATSLNYPNTSGNLSCLIRSNNSLKRNIELTLQDVINGNVEQATSLNYPNTSGNLSCLIRSNNSLKRNIELTLQDVINGNIEQATSLNYPNTSGNLSCLIRSNNSLKRNIELTLQDVINGNIEQATSLSYPNTSGNLSCLIRSNNSLKRNIELTLQDVINGNVEQATSLNYPNTSGNLSCLIRSNNSLKRNIELTLQDVINGNIEQATSLNYPNTSGNLSCLKRSNNSLKRNIELTLQDIINGNIEQATSLNYPNTSGVEDVPDFIEVTPESTSSVYYHKKIRAEQVRERRSTLNTRCELPRINEAFGQFRGNHIRHDVTQPLYVQVSEESERILNYPQFAKRNTNLLETVYNFKSHFLTNQPLLQLATTTNTKCVYSTPTVATAAPQRPATTYTEPYMASYERDQYYGTMDNSRMNDCLRFVEHDYDFRCYEDPNRSSSSIGTVQSQDLGANVTISDMVEDALELISQDGDYMERMGMDVRMQCVLCNWAGPKIILEYHIRKEHSNDIDKQEKREWNITYSLGSVHQQLWKSRVIEHESALYVLSVKYEPPGCFLATLATLTTDPELTTGSITVFNKVTGEPHTWIGEIQELPPSLPYDNQPGLQLDLASLDLIPNSANLKLMNGELVLQSPSKVVFGQIELNDIHIILFVKIS
ncbi:putative uncharacterized protein DDB_G0277255 [Cydia splendana]|uniref:putative uncharacterized protein DDB_G0277255 n=1 Tax=Cydia splendana TaxID=1100963 RepID=UPI00300C011A